METFRGLVLIALVACLAGATGLAADDPADLHILKARFEFGPRPGTDRIVLKALFDPAALTAGLTPENSDLEVMIASETVLSVPPLSERMTLRSKKERIWRLRLKAVREHRDSCKLKIDVEKGKLKLTGDRLDLRDVRGDGAEAVTFTLTVAGASFTKTIELGVRDGRWRYRYTGPAFVPSDPGGGIPPIDPGPPPDDSVEFRYLHLANTQATFGDRTIVLRTQSELAAEWEKYAAESYIKPATPVPTVDFTKEIVILIDYGLEFQGGSYSAEVKSVTEVGDGLLVEWWAWSPGGCPVPGVPEPTCMFVAVTRRDGAVTFTKKSKTAQCW